MDKLSKVNAYVSGAEIESVVQLFGWTTTLIPWYLGYLSLNHSYDVSTCPNSSLFSLLSCFLRLFASIINALFSSSIHKTSGPFLTNSSFSGRCVWNPRIEPNLFSDSSNWLVVAIGFSCDLISSNCAKYPFLCLYSKIGSTMALDCSPRFERETYGGSTCGLSKDLFRE